MGQGKDRILVVDDNEMNLDMLTRRLARRGYRTSSAKDGEQALEKIANDDFDLVLLDIMMPRISGLEVLAEVRKTKSHLQLPIIMVTAKESSEDIVTALSLGANDYVTKPLDMSVLLARANTHLELKRLSMTLEYSIDELEAKNEDLNEFNYVASHDLQEPLRKMISFGRLLEQELGENASEDATKNLGFIVDAADRMKRLIQDLLKLSRASQEELQFDRVDLNACVDRAIVSLQSRLEETRAQIIRPKLPTVVGNPTLLNQLYQNLVGNALKFIGDEQPMVQLTFEQDAENWILGVRDNGIGIEPELAKRVFEPFARLHSRNEYSGTGIGLAICNKAVRKHGGRIWVESQKGAGAHFRFTLPRLQTRSELASSLVPVVAESELNTQTA